MNQNIETERRRRFRVSVADTHEAGANINPGGSELPVLSAANTWTRILLELRLQPVAVEWFILREACMHTLRSEHNASTPQGRDHQANPFRTFPSSETKYSPTFIPGKGQAYGEKSRSPFQTECQSLDGSEEGSFNKYQLFLQRPSCKTPPEGSKLHADSGHNGSLIPCYEVYNFTLKPQHQGSDLHGLQLQFVLVQRKQN
ncbi:hypothetical protein NQZ68_007815 [Dissostichus eleginoides]|nr:hypothetical protein NQZ68_007815 [Dissostichus eleginoides]